jgi:hypothetical protein
MKQYVIGIAGCANSGKDTIASMINYIFVDGITQASYQRYVVRRVSIDGTFRDRIVHFADTVKDVLSCMYNIPRSYFDDRVYKDEYWYNLTKGEFIKQPVVIGPGYNVINIEHLSDDWSLHDILKTYDELDNVIKLRTLMQYFGTNICRDKMGDDIWVNATMRRAVDVANARRLCIIPDVRFDNEASAIRKLDDSLYGGVIKISRQSDTTATHESEVIDFACNYEIYNDGTLMQLFYKVLDICQQIVLE